MLAKITCLPASKIGRWFLLLFISLWFTSGTQAQAAFPTGCPTPPTPTGKAWYVDPVHGSMTGDGSATHPWSTLSAVIAANLISSQTRGGGNPTYSTPLKPLNPSGVVHPGDVIYLLSGNHGYIGISGYVNSSFITVQALPGQTPVLQGLELLGSSQWAFEGLTIQNTSPNLPAGVDGALVLIGNGWTGPTDHIYVANNHLSSAPANVVAGWSVADWNSNVSSGFSIYGPTNVTLIGNSLQYVAVGVGFSQADNIVFQSNTIDTFALDGMDIAGTSDILIQGNTETNNRNIGGNHNDMIQGFPYYALPNAVASNIYIDSNTMIESTSPSNFPNVSGVFCHGIGVFDGNWSNFNVTNNFVVVATWHGITLSGMNGATVINNTVLSRFADTNEG
jgi:Right handed beta helix region